MAPTGPGSSLCNRLGKGPLKVSTCTGPMQRGEQPAVGLINGHHPSIFIEDRNKDPSRNPEPVDRVGAIDFIF